MSRIIRTTARRLGAARAAAILVVVAALTAAARLPAVTAPITPSSGNRTAAQGRQIALRDQLRVGLYAFTKADMQFINLVVLRVQQGVLPRSLVDSTFLWARQRTRTTDGRYRKRPIVYFQPALTLRAKQLGITL
ncbi:MAG: hypothetical protein CMJ58_06505 [Planctomycetaceae bacterium]|nr:hypothetical protein [Planctomycetaceae bacterium]